MLKTASVVKGCTFLFTGDEIYMLLLALCWDQCSLLVIEEISLSRGSVLTSSTVLSFVYWESCLE